MLRQLLTPRRCLLLCALLVAAAALVIVLASTRRQDPTRAQVSHYLKTLETMKRLSSEYAKRCPHSDTTEEQCVQLAAAAAAERASGHLEESARNLASAPDTCWCYS